MPTLDAAWPHAPGGDILIYITAVIVLLGSPGPGIAALLAVGRERGLAGALEVVS
ncbi:MAG TPA: hypothetical protein VFS40_12680 [Gemmatimonadales bacterium]|nr:hypothetical protein [Gemmatimonadales bacterium]